MVIHDDNEQPIEVSSKKVFESEETYVFDGKRRKYTDGNSSIMDNPNENSIQPQNGIEENVRKRKIKSRKKGSDSEEILHQNHKISSEDLEELKTVYKKCKDVMEKIESKYGHLLNLDIEEPSSKHKKKTENLIENKCLCTLNKKIVFDEDGKEVTIDTLPSNHIYCPQKLTLQPNVTPIENKSVQIEYASNDIQLSDDLQELATILQNSDLETTYRNKVIDKIRSIKQENSNDIKFNKHNLVEKLKSDPDAIFEFKGANLSVLSGYS